MVSLFMRGFKHPWIKKATGLGRIWNIEEHTREDIKTNGQCCFDHLIDPKDFSIGRVVISIILLTFSLFPFRLLR